MMIIGRARCMKCGKARKACSLKDKSLELAAGRAPSGKKRKTGDAASVASGSQTSEKRLRPRKSKSSFTLVSFLISLLRRSTR